MSVHLGNVTNYMRQQLDTLTAEDIGRPSEVYSRNLCSALSSLAQASCSLSRILEEIQSDEPFITLDNCDSLERLTQLAESESRCIKEIKAGDFMRMSGIHFREHFGEFSVQFCSICDNASVCLTSAVKSVMFNVRDRRDRETYARQLRVSVAVLFSVTAAMMLSVSIGRTASALDLAVSGIWLISLSCGVAAGITGTAGLFFSESSSLYRPSDYTIAWITRIGEILFLVSAMLFSTGLNVFAFSSSQAVVARAIVTIFTIFHFLGLFTLFIWLIQSRQSNESNIKSHSLWSTARNLGQLSLRPVSGARDSGDPKDIEKGVRPRTSVRTVAPPIIHVTDTEPDMTTTAPTNNLTDNPGHTPPASPQYPMDSDSDSEHDLTSLSFSHAHTNLVVPSAHRVSSDSSRSLPALPNDVQVARCMAYSPNGMFLCIGNNSPQERCTIFSTDSPAIVLGELKLTDVARQIEWSQDGENILLRLSHMIYIWNAMPSVSARRPVIVVHHEADNMKWIPSSDSFLSCKQNILTSFKFDGTPTGAFHVPALSVQDILPTKDGHRVICLVSNIASSRSGKSSSSPQKLLVYNLENKTVEQVAPVGREAQSIIPSSMTPDHILVNFTGNTPPQLWRYREDTDSSDRRTSATFLSFKRTMSFKAPSGHFSGHGILGGTDDTLILSLEEVGDMFIFDRESGQPLRHVQTSTSRFNASDRKSITGSEQQPGRNRLLAQCVAWDPDILAFTVCMGFADGSIWQWKLPFDALSQEDSTGFSVVTLSDDDSTMIRAADADKGQKVEGDG
ncbi:uncharacterized protein FOMMEDRAFT_134626 [Fomitiporia mediterranea MF3/22]|uniref:uncharacterized protein n=1 Tax=Fomitiporia mediterranea (strain MF3/22) TaxID=694068 RepID=UPI0004407469|nr:uncharacterized protein FOMMEDRAFT_134626 [Fomitiporia mediterranea MF3/22]EJD01997.1 hypothetical protein FOMMEDRAFT_134626 [Fomitiporia mediterranea MF3/22]